MTEPASARQARKDFNAPRRNPQAPVEGPPTRGAPGGNGAWSKKNAKRAANAHISSQNGETPRLVEDQTTEGRIKRQEIFLKGLSEFGTIRAACDAANVDRRTYYNWIEKFPEFKEAVEISFEDNTDDLEKEAHKRAKDKSDNLLMFLIKARRPHFRDNYVAPTRKVGDADQRRESAAANIKSKLEVLKERQTAGVKGALTSGGDVETEEEGEDDEFEDKD